MAIIISESRNDINQQELSCIELALKAIDELHEPEGEKKLSCVQKTIYEENFRFEEVETRYQELIDKSHEFSKTYKRELNSIGFLNTMNRLLCFELVDPCGFVNTTSIGYNKIVEESFEEFKKIAPSLRGLRKTYANYIELMFLPNEEIINIGFSDAIVKIKEDLLARVNMTDVLNSFEYVPSKKYYTYETRRLLEEVHLELAKIEKLINEVDGVEKSIYGNMLTIIAILVAVFSMIGLNTTAMANESIELDKMVYLNIALLIVLTWIFALVDKVANTRTKLKLRYVAGGSIVVSIALLIINSLFL